jgi:hypothetical protein
LLRKISEPKKGEVTGEKEEISLWESSWSALLTNIIRVIKSRRMIRAGYVVLMGLRRGTYLAFVSKRKKWGHFENLVTDGRIILKRILKKFAGIAGLDWSVSGYGEWTGCCGDSNDTSSYIKVWGILE